MPITEQELVRELDAHDALAARCAGGELGYDEFDKEYDNFYPRYPLDGHESEPDPALLRKHASRIALHEAIWEEVLTKVTDDVHLPQPGFIGRDTAVRRLRELVGRHLEP